MSAMCTEPHGTSRAPSLSARESRSISPRKRVQSESQRAARSARPPPCGNRRLKAAHGGLVAVAAVEDLDRCRAQDDDEHCREDEQHQRDDHLDRRLLRLLLRPLLALGAQLVGLNSHDTPEADPGMFGLNDGVDERRDILGSSVRRAKSSSASRPRAAQRHLAQAAPKFLRERRPCTLSATRANDASMPSPASTLVVIRSMASGKALRIIFRRFVICPLSQTRGR